MKKITAHFLIALMLFSNAVWAVDSNFISVHNDIEATEQAIDLSSDDTSDQHNSSEDGDHCCHGAAHLIGMTSVKLASAVHLIESLQLQKVTTLISFKHLPPTPPPTI